MMLNIVKKATPHQKLDSQINACHAGYSECLPAGQSLKKNKISNVSLFSCLVTNLNTIIPKVIIILTYPITILELNCAHGNVVKLLNVQLKIVKAWHFFLVAMSL